MLVGQQRRLWRRFLPGGVVLEALLVAVLCSLRRASAPAPAFASSHMHRPGRAWSSASLRWRMLCRHSNLADALPLSSRWLKFGQIAVVGCSGGCLATFVRLLTFAPGRCLFLLADSVVELWLGVRVVPFVLSVLLCCCLCCRCICVCIFSVFL